MDNLIVNSDFDTDSDWALGDGWTIADGLLSWNFQVGNPASVSPTDTIGLVAGETYLLSFSITGVNIALGGDNFTIALGGDVVATMTEDTTVSPANPLIVVCGSSPELDIVISGTSVGAGTTGNFDYIVLTLFITPEPIRKGNLDIVNETNPSDFEYTVPDRCISLTIQARDGVITVIEGNNTNIWTQDPGTKEEYIGDVAIVMRGQTLVFNGTAHLEIRCVIDNRI